MPGVLISGTEPHRERERETGPVCVISRRLASWSKISHTEIQRANVVAV